jgi:ferredoxin-thioredoxin reductase catalytic chain
MTAQELYDKLRPIQEAKGQYFNADPDMTLPLLESLLVNKERYGYMACPCRLASGTFELDRDVVCPCVYRDPDVAEHGACYCGLYVSKALHDAAGPAPVVEERRPPEKVRAALGL